MHEPELVLADEPTANLDHKTAFSIIKLMFELREQLGVSFLLSTHDDRVIKKIHNLIKLEDGVLQS